MRRRGLAWGLAALGLLCGCRGGGGSTRTGGAERSVLAQIRQLPCADLRRWLAARKAFTLIDVREDDEWRAGHAASARHLSRWTVVERIGTLVPDKGAPIVLYCGSGKRSAMAAVGLQRAGYTNVFSLAGGLKAYTAAGLPLAR